MRRFSLLLAAFSVWIHSSLHFAFLLTGTLYSPTSKSSFLLSHLHRRENQFQHDPLYGSTDDDGSTKRSAATSTTKPFVNQATIQFNNKLNKLAKNFDKHTAPQVERLLKDVLTNIERGLELEIQPNVVTFTAVINAWARSSRLDAAPRAEAILQLLLQLTDDPNNVYLLQLEPNVIAYNAAITAWVRSKQKDSHNHAERLLLQLWDSFQETENPELKPNSRTFNLVINAIARSRELKCADRAAALLARMEGLYTMGDDQLEPDASTFGAIINAYANEGDSADKAAQLLQQMESMYQLGYKRMKPNTFVYNACLNAFAKCSATTDSAEQALQLLELMKQQYAKGDLSVKPDVITYSTCINAQANSGKVDAGVKADAILHTMTCLYLEGDPTVQPNAIAYTATMKAWMAAVAAETEPTARAVACRSAADRTEALLHVMVMQYLAGSDPSQKPTNVTFDIVVEAMAQVGDVVGKDRTEALRNRILESKVPRRESV